MRRIGAEAEPKNGNERMIPTSLVKEGRKGKIEKQAIHENGLTCMTSPNGLLSLCLLSVGSYFVVLRAKLVIVRHRLEWLTRDDGVERFGDISGVPTINFRGMTHSL